MRGALYHPMGAIIANAVYEAIGVRLYELPMTPPDTNSFLDDYFTARFRAFCEMNFKGFFALISYPVVGFFPYWLLKEDRSHLERACQNPG